VSLAIDTIRDAATDREIGRFRNATWSDGGTLELADGRQFRASTNLWMTRYEFHNDRGEAFLAFVRIRGVVHLSSRVEFTPDAARVAELPLLVVLGWYLTVGMHNDAGAAAAAAAAG